MSTMRFSLLSVSIYALYAFTLLPTAYAQGLARIEAELAEGACNAKPVKLIGHNVQYTLNGTMILARPLKNDSTYDDENKFGLFTKQIIEQLATGGTGRSCRTDSPVVQTLDLKSCSCASTPYLLEGPGYKDAGQMLDFFNCTGHSNFTFSLYMAIPNATHEELFNTTVLGSTYDNFTYTSPGGGLKLGMTMKDWNWDKAAEMAGNDTFLGLTFELWAQSPVGIDLNFFQTDTALVFLFNVSDYPFNINMEKGIIFDGQPSIVGGAGPSNEASLPPLNRGWYAFGFNHGFCTSTLYPMPRHHNISYDPSIVSLFSNDPTIPGSKPSTTVGIAVGVTIGALALFVIIAIILVWKVPAVRHFVRPFSKRRRQGQQHPSNVPTSSHAKDWTSASKPSVS